MKTAAVLTASDRGAGGEREDESGRIAAEILTAMGFVLKHRDIVPDDKELIKEKLIGYSNAVDLVITTGGTGLSPRDVTPDATSEVIERDIPGIPETMRAYGIGKTKRAMLSRAVAGVKGKTLIINLPGSPSGVKEGLEAIMEVILHAIEKIQGGKGDCAR